MRCGSTPRFLGLERSPRAYRYQLQRNSNTNPPGVAMLDRRGRRRGQRKSDPRDRPVIVHESVSFSFGLSVAWLWLTKRNSRSPGLCP
ncbi:MAG: hypothetical protein AAGA67_04480 [Cyanobacteria bacterium P01_F01_bin.153]